MGTVWAAYDETLGRQVAVKEVTPPAGLDVRQRGELRQRTLREARAAARIDSPAAVTVFDVVEEDGRPWIVMQLVQAPTLADVIRRDGPLPTPHVARMGVRLLDALSAAHAAGVLHRDVKPANVLMPPDGAAVLTDFGIASLEGDPSTTATGMIVGSPAYMAPERARGSAPSPASDLWSLGATLATAVRGRSPFERDGQLATLLAVVNDEPVESAPPGPLAEAIAGLLHKDPAERLTAAEARALLERAADLAPQAPLAAAPAAAPSIERTQPVPVLPAPPAPAAPAAASPAPALPAAADSAPAAHRVAAASPARSTVPQRPAAPAQGRPMPVRALAGGLVAAAVAGGLYAFWPEPDSDPTPRVAASSGRPSPAVSGRATERGAERGATKDARPSSPMSATSPSSRAAGTNAAAAPTTSAAPAPTAAVSNVGRHESEAFSIAVPDGWQAERSGNRTTFREPGGRGFFFVEGGGAPKGDPLADWRRQEPGVAARLSGYKKIRIERADFGRFQAADWEFTWQPPRGQLRVLNRNVVDGDRAYAVYWSVPAEAWDDTAALRETVLASFDPSE